MDSIDKSISVVIPSHNATELLAQTLRQLILIKKNHATLEICVSDNSENDNTYDFLRNNHEIWSEIKYKKADDSKLLDENILSAVSMASNEYVWLLGDDDIPSLDSIKEIEDVIDARAPGIIIMNSSSFYDDIVIEKERHPADKDLCFDKTENNEFLQELGSYVTFISSIVIKKSIWDSVSMSKYIGTYFMHLATLLDAKPKTDAFFLNKPLVSMRVYSQVWTERYFEIWKIELPKIIWGNKEYSDDAKSSVIRKNPLESIMSLASVRAYGFLKINIYKKYIYYNDDISLFKKTIIFLMLLVPVKFMKFLYKLIILLNLKSKGKQFSPELAMMWLNR